MDRTEATAIAGVPETTTDQFRTMRREDPQGLTNRIATETNEGGETTD